MSNIDELIEKLNRFTAYFSGVSLSAEPADASGDTVNAALFYETAAALSTLQEQKGRLEEALRNLGNEVDALGFLEDEIRGFIGNTNWSILRLRLDEARALLSGGGEG
jgi:hypothetical protein